jgi:hypothetical protein
MTEEIIAELRAANNAQGEARAFIHVAGYTLKLGLDRLEWLLAEERWRQCGFDDITAFAESVRINENFQPVAEKRKQLAILFKQADSDKPLSHRRIAKALNVSDQTVGRDLAATNVAPGEKNASEAKGAKYASATNVAPAMLDGEEAGKAAARRN